MGRKLPLQEMDVRTQRAMTIYRVLAAVLAVLLLAAAANYYLDLGWVGDRGRFVLSMLLLSTVVLIAVAIRRGQDRQ